MLPFDRVDHRPGQRSMPPQEEPPLNFTTFWTLLGKLMVRLMRERAHGQVVITIHQGQIPIVEVNRKYKPTGLPE